ncbi:hypothetical protein COB28_02835 [Candidatus Dependentiae bacterium]|nr:MAG: hypothetical protein COB28_02835 [Candidatus Dependentiae bacterium]
MKKLPLGIQTFSKLRENDYLYVDKTEHLYRLIQEECCFFARPRRFGKSILCSTLASLFQGKKELFKDLWISKNTDYDWPIHPVIHIDFNGVSVESPQLFSQSLMLELKRIATIENLIELEMSNPGTMLKDLMLELVKKYDNKKVVLIIDEYDRPVLHHLTKPQSLEQMQDIIRNFYTSIKGVDALLKFLFVTGISRFSKANLFSGFNQIQDISMNPQFAHLVGYVESELNSTLSEHMIVAAHDSGKSLEEFKEATKSYYNGYRFWKNLPAGKSQIDIPRIYNPFSVMHNINNPTFECYWFSSGTPTFLMNLFKRDKYQIESFEALEISEEELGAFEPTLLPLNTLLYQTGYLTIKKYDLDSKNFILTYPNIEVKEAFLQRILVWISEVQSGQINKHAAQLRKAINMHDLELLISTLKSFYATIPYTIQLDQEKYYQTIFYIILTLLGITIDVEIATNIGRIDAVIKTEKYIYIIEFKLDLIAYKAIEQIKTKKYYEQYQQDSRPITLIGITFSRKEKNISDVIIEKFKKN